MNKSLWLRATLICGTLDIAYAIGMTLFHGGDPLKMLSGLASGPLGNAVHDWGLLGSLAGLLVHFAIMAIMVAIFLLAYQKTNLKSFNPWLVGTFYGVGLYLVMYGIVMPLRFHTHFPPADLLKIVAALVPHILLVGIPIALMTYKYQPR